MIINNPTITMNGARGEGWTVLVSIMLANLADC